MDIVGDEAGDVDIIFVVHGDPHRSLYQRVSEGKNFDTISTKALQEILNLGNVQP